MNNIVIQYKDEYVCGYSLKTGMVYTTKDPVKARKFTSVASQNFIREHGNKGRNFDLEFIQIHVFTRGAPSIFTKPKEN